MKKLILTFAMVLVAVCAMRASDAPLRWLDLGVHIGDGISSVRQNYPTQIPSVATFRLTPGNTFLAGASATLRLRSWFGIGTGLDFTVNNYAYGMTIVNGAGAAEAAGTLTALDVSNRYYAFEVPLFLQFRWGGCSLVNWLVETGAYIGYGVGGHTNTTSFRSLTNSLGQSQVSGANYSTGYFNDDMGLINRISPTDAGFHIAAGVEAGRHFQIKAVFHAGMRNLARDFGVYDTSLRNIGLTFRAGYIF